MENKDKFVKCINMDARVFIEFILDYFNQFENIEVRFDSIIKTDFEDVRVDLVSRDTSSTNEYFITHKFLFDDIFPDKKHRAMMNINRGRWIYIEKEWNDFLAKKEAQASQNQESTEAQPE